ncbi:MAG TPA: TVP38/TMEM64 family protein [Myxococcota bacterium]|nr:TVP38/TMEM64 family protein [Myxococcota bacterium]
MPASDATSASARFGWKSVGWILGLGILLVGVRFLNISEWLKQALAWVSELGVWGVVAFVGLYVAAAVLLIPGSILTLGAGAVFGVAWGCVYVSVASTLGATCAFLVGRYFARAAIARRIEGNPRFSALDRAVAAEGWKIVGLARLSPIFPFTLLNYAFGLTQVRLSHYVLASWIGMMPGTVLYVYLGSLAGAAAGTRNRTPGEWVLYGVGLLATVAVAVQVTRIARRALAERIEPEPPR